MGCVSKFLFSSTPPCVDHKLNAAETLGNKFLSPLSHAAGRFSIKTKEDESFCLQRIGAVALIIITIPLTLIGIILKGLGQIWPHKKIHATDATANLHLTSPQRVKECYHQVAAMQRVFIESGFVQEDGLPKFMIACGTALGAERHGGMIPWDDDVDVAVFDETGFLALKDKLQEAGLELDSGLRFNSIYKLKFSQQKFKEFYPEADYSSQGELDVFIWSKMADGSYTYDTSFARSNWPTEYITAEEMAEGFVWKPFGTLQLPGIKSQANYVKRSYGDNCLSHGLQTHTHAKICGIVCPFAKFGAHYFEIQTYKPCVQP